MTKILFICHGNICRSPMAEFVMKDLAAKAGKRGAFEIASAAVSREELGNPVYPPAKRKLLEHGIRCDGHAARQMTRADYDKFDYIIGMDSSNLRGMQRICGGDPEHKFSLLMEPPIVPATWLTRGTPAILKRPGAMFMKAAPRF